MLGNFDVEQFVYLLDCKLMLVLDNSLDVGQILKVLLHVDDVHDDIHLNVDVDVYYYQYYIEILIMNNVLRLLHFLLMLFVLIDYNHNVLYR